jgi:hypothetical protein
MRRRLETDDEPARSVDDPTRRGSEPVDERLQRTLRVAHGVILAPARCLRKHARVRLPGTTSYGVAAMTRGLGSATVP